MINKPNPSHLSSSQKPLQLHSQISKKSKPSSTTMTTRSPRPSFSIHAVIAENPFVVEGIALPLYSKTEGDAMVVRMDVPGLNQGNVNVWADNGGIHFEGEDPRGDPEFDKEIKRKFKGEVVFPCGAGIKWKTEEMKYVVKDGVLKIKIPKAADTKK